MQGFLLMAALILLAGIPVLLAYLWLARRRPYFVPLRFALALPLGFLALALASFLQYLIPRTSEASFLSLLARGFLVIALTEEAARYIAVRAYFLSAGRFRAFFGVPADPKEGVTAGLVVGLSFAMLETAAYAMADPGIALVRIFSAAPLHGACGIRVGFAAQWLGAAPARAVLRFFSAVAIHGVYNLVGSLPVQPWFFSVPLALLAFGAALPALLGSAGEKE